MNLSMLHSGPVSESIRVWATRDVKTPLNSVLHNSMVNCLELLLLRCCLCCLFQRFCRLKKDSPCRHTQNRTFLMFTSANFGGRETGGRAGCRLQDVGVHRFNFGCMWLQYYSIRVWATIIVWWNNVKCTLQMNVWLLTGPQQELPCVHLLAREGSWRPLCTQNRTFHCVQKQRDRQIKNVRAWPQWTEWRNTRAF